MLVEENKLLAPFTTLGIGGPARWFVEAASEDEIVEATGWARERGLALFVLGGGSNLLVSDAGFDGLVVRVQVRGVSVEETSAGSQGSLQRVYSVAAGEDWDSFVQRAVEDSSAGVECLAGIPGTVGGTPVQNVGAYGQEVGTVIERVRAFDLTDRVFVELSAEECGFAYRRSRFNSEDRGRFIVSRVGYRLLPGGAPTLRYGDVREAMAPSLVGGQQPTLAEVAAAVRRIRRAKGMLLVDADPDCRSAGSFFKNPVVSEAHFRRITESSPAPPPSFLAGPGLVKMPAAWLIEQAGFSKGYTRGAAGISSRHTLALVNKGGASSLEMMELADQIKEKIETKFGIPLEMEPVMVGFES